MTGSRTQQQVHYYPDGAWWKPFWCLRCHPWWFFGSGVLIALVANLCWSWLA